MQRVSSEDLAAVGSQEAAAHCCGKMSGKRQSGGRQGVVYGTSSKQDRAECHPLHVSCEGLAAAFAGAGGSDHVAACAILEEAEARLVKKYLDLADGGGAAAISPEHDGLEMKKAV